MLASLPYTYLNMSNYKGNNNMKFSKLLVLSLLSGGLVLSSCGGSPEGGDPGDPSSNPNQGWIEITKEEFATYFSEKEAAPWTHMEGTNGVEPRDESGNLTMKTVVEDFVDPNWVVDASKSYEGAYDLSDVLVLTQYNLDTFLNPPEGATVTLKKKGNLAEKFQMNIHMEKDGMIRDAFSELDKYFYATDMIVQSNANESHTYRVDQEAHVTWSVLVAGHTFKYDSIVSDVDPNQVSLDEGSEIIFTNDGHIGIKTTIHGEDYGEDHNWTTTIKGDYEQNGNMVSFALFGVEVEGFSEQADGWQPYSDEMAATFVLNATITSLGSLAVQWYDNQGNLIEVLYKLSK